MFLAGNQVGKTLAAGFEWAMHLCGIYPDWWRGARFEYPVIFWASSLTGKSTRDNPQRILVGPPALQSEWGTGAIPGDRIIGFNRAVGTPNLLDNVQVKWRDGGASQCIFHTYEEGRMRWQGPTIDGVWFDEEPPADIYTEGVTRTNNGQRGQFAMLTLTPLLGHSEVVDMFINDCGLP